MNKRLIGDVGNDLFLHKEFYPVGQWLKNSKRAGAVRAHPILNERGYLALHVGRVHRYKQCHCEYHADQDKLED